jgi:hypothetical protein
LAWLAMWRLRHRSREFQWLAGGLTLIGVLLGMSVVCGIGYGADATAGVLVGAMIEWPGQIAVLWCLSLIARPGRRTCGG